MPQKYLLAIDDDEDILYTIRQICEYEGWHIFTATSYSQAQACLKDNRIDLVLIDYHMPEMDGMAMLRALRRQDPKVPFLVLTVEEQGSIAEKFKQAGASDYALKPIKAVDLIARIHMHLQYSERSQYYDDYTKGISKVTLKTIEDALASADSFLCTEEIEAKTGIKRKTLYRYLQYLVKENRVELEYTYQGSGRPKSAYRMKM